jgi:hypothetical protein
MQLLPRGDWVESGQMGVGECVGFCLNVVDRVYNK